MGRRSSEGGREGASENEGTAVGRIDRETEKVLSVPGWDIADSAPGTRR
jgi:hypothetical protein